MTFWGFVKVKLKIGKNRFSSNAIFPYDDLIFVHSLHQKYRNTFLVLIFNKYVTMNISRFSRLSVKVVRSFSTTTKAPPATGIAILDPTIGLTADQAEIYQLARSFADNELKPFAQEWDEKHEFPLETYKKFGDLGFAGIFVKEEVGGTALSRLDTVNIIEGLATGCVGTTAMLSIHNMCAGMIDKFANDEQRNYWLPKMCKLDVMASYCLTEPGSGSDAGSLSTRAKFDSATNEYVINGGKQFISGAGEFIVCNFSFVNVFNFIFMFFSIIRYVRYLYCYVPN
jgi:hypothetical protein